MNNMLSDKSVDQDLLTQCRNLIVQFMDGTCPTQSDVRTQMYSQTSTSEQHSRQQDTSENSLSITKSTSSQLDSFNVIASAMKVSASCINISSLNKSNCRLSRSKIDEDLSSEVLVSDDQVENDTKEVTSSTNNASYEHLDIIPFESVQ